PAGMLVGIVTSSIALLDGIWRDPEMLAREARALGDAGRWGRKRGDIAVKHQAIADRLTHPVRDIRINHAPEAAAQGINQALGLGFVTELPHRGMEGGVERIGGARRVRLD